MSRRPNPAADRTAQNAQTLKALVKLEGNKVCADCKRNKHPRWASWNLGVFVCIRCSGIHRGMGTHISRVKSVDLDAWTDEQLQNILKWGNTRANRYWEAKLALGHVPSEAKIENFIRTKYDSKRWVMDGPMPDPATLDTDDDVPLNIVQEKAKIERSASQRASQTAQSSVQVPRPVPAQNIDLFGDFATEPPPRPSTADIPATTPSAPAVPKSKQDSLLGLDFFGSSQGAGIGRPSSTASNPVQSTNPRGDLKNSILSLYASAPKPQPASQASHERQPSFGGLTSQPVPQQDAFGGLTNAFGGLSFTPGNKPKSPAVQSQSSALSGLDFVNSVPTKSAPAAAQVSSPPPLSGGSFFGSGPSKPAVPKAPVAAPNASQGLNFSFTQRTTSPPVSASKPAPSTIPTDLFADEGFADFSSPAVSTATAPAPAQSQPSPAVPPQSDFGSAFNLSSAPPPAPKTDTLKSSRPALTTQSSAAMFDPWGANDANAWGAPEPVQAKPAASKVELGSVPTHLTPNDIRGGWGSPLSSAHKATTQPTVTADEDFGGWTSAPAQTPGAPSSKPSATFGSSDPFDNPWG